METSSSAKRSTSKTVDRISGLTDDVLCRILALLPTRSAFATSILSRRWEYVWTGVPVLNFTHKQGDKISSNSSIDTALQYRSLKYIMNRVLHNSALCLERVDFDVLPIMTEEDRNEWVNVLSSRPIKKLNLSCDQCWEFPIMKLLGGALREHLVALRLHSEIENSYFLTAPVDTMVHLPMLEKVLLSGVKVTDDGGLLRSLLHGSPRLRELVMYQCTGSATNVHCSALKILKLVLPEFTAANNFIVPNLEYFEVTIGESYADLDHFQYLTGDMPCLAEAKVYQCTMSAAMWTDLFHKLRHVIKLTVSLSPFIFNNSGIHLQLPCFERLKCLKISCTEEDSIIQIRMLLKHMPNCVTLIIQLQSRESRGSADRLTGWPIVNSVGLGLQVENIEINGFGKNIALLRNLLDCCSGLKEMKLHLMKGQSSRHRNVLRNEIMKLSNPSGCKITICMPCETVIVC